MGNEAVNTVGMVVLSGPVGVCGLVSVVLGYTSVSLCRRARVLRVPAVHVC
jgi:hypothetical protein